MTIQNLLTQLKGVKRGQNGYLAKCPAHEDDRQSLAITETADRTLVNCFAGCSTEQILKTLGMEWQQLFQEEKRTESRSFSSQGVGGVIPANAKTRAIYRYT